MERELLKIEKSRKISKNTKNLENLENIGNLESAGFFNNIRCTFNYNQARTVETRGRSLPIVSFLGPGWK